MRRVVVAVTDLFFAARIAAAARTLGVRLDEAAPTAALEACRAGPVELVIVDLEAEGALELVRALKADPALAPVPVVAFYPHVRTEVRAAAAAAGAERVMPRSAFTRLLPGLLAGEARGID